MQLIKKVNKVHLDERKQRFAFYLHHTRESQFEGVSSNTPYTPFLIPGVSLELGIQAMKRELHNFALPIHI